jgi:hypothetical membrane protein
MTANNLTPSSLYRNLAVTGALLFCFAFVLVHIIRDDLSLLHRTLSIYAVGPAGWVLTLGFFSIAGTQILVAFRLYQLRRSAVELLAVALLVVAAIGIVLVAIFPYTVKLPHNTGAALQLGLFPLFLLLQVALHRDKPLWKFTLVCAVLSAALFLLLIWNGQTDYDLGSVGMAQKAQIIVNTLWLVVFSWHLPARKAS